MDPLVWLPFDPDRLGDVPGLRLERAHPPRDGSTWEVPSDVAEVAVYVPDYAFAKNTGEVIAQMPSLRVVQTLSAGTEHIEPFVPADVILCNGRGIHDAATAEMALTLMLSSIRLIPQIVRDQDEHVWDRVQRSALADKRVLVVGAGAIGRAIAARLAPFETQVTMVGRTAREGIRAIDELPGLLPDADIVVLIVPLTDETRHLVDDAFLDAMPDGSLLVNVARGGVVDTDALLRQDGRVHAALDVTDPEPLPVDHPLWDAPNVLISPHVAGGTTAMWPRVDRLIRSQLARFVAGEPLDNVVDR